MKGSITIDFLENTDLFDILPLCLSEPGNNGSERALYIPQEAYHHMQFNVRVGLVWFGLFV